MKTERSLRMGSAMTTARKRSGRRAQQQKHESVTRLKGERQNRETGGKRDRCKTKVRCNRREKHDSGNTKIIENEQGS